MNPLRILSTILCLSVFSSFSRAEADPIFPVAGTDYQMTYATLPAAQSESGIRLRILKVQPNGWILASKVYYSYAFSKKTAEKPLPEVIDRKLVVSEPSWFNLAVFSEAREIKKG